MPNFCANLTWLFTELPFIERFSAAKDAGFEAVEVISPFEVNAQDIVNELGYYGLQMVLINAPPPNYAGGSRGWAAVAGLEARFKTDFRRSLRYANKLGVKHLHIMAGVADGPEAEATFISNLKWAAAEAPEQSLTIEPINSTDMPDYFLSDFYQARDIIAAVGAPNLRLQFDAYHAAKIHGDPCKLWRDFADITAHVQVAQVPDRTEPVRGTIDYPAFFALLDETGYQGWVSGEYRPAKGTVAGLDWLAVAD